MGRKIKSTIRIAIYACIFVAISLVVLIALTIQTKPLVQQSAPSASEDAIAGTEALRRTKRMLTKTGEIQNYSATLEEINSVLALASKRFHQLRGNAEIIDNTLQLRGTVQLPLGNNVYLNAQSSIKSGQTFSWNNSKVGNLPIPNSIANALFKMLGSRFVQSHFSSWVEDGVQSVAVSDTAINIEALLPADLPGQMQNTIGLLGGISSEEQEKMSELAHYYLDQLEQSSANLSSEKEQFSSYLNILSSAVLHRVQTDNANFKEELTTAVFALAYAMTPSIMNPFLPSVNHSFRLPNVKLDGRDDFAKHFILSAVLEILSNKEVAFTIGELKELQDSQGGSGYSLKDIAADRAGIYFIQAISNNEIVAQRFVSPRYVLSDLDYFPDVTGLQEGLTESEFKQRYSSTQSREYLNLIRQIDNRIAILPLYRR